MLVKILLNGFVFQSGDFFSLLNHNKKFIYTGENIRNCWRHALHPSDQAEDHAHLLIRNHRLQSLSSVETRTGAADVRIVVVSWQFAGITLGLHNYFLCVCVCVFNIQFIKINLISDAVSSVSKM